MKAKDENLSEMEIDAIVIAQANDEKAWTDIGLLKSRAKCGSREKFLKALSKVPNAEPVEEDKIK